MFKIDIKLNSLITENRQLITGAAQAIEAEFAVQTSNIEFGQQIGAESADFAGTPAQMRPY